MLKKRVNILKNTNYIKLIVMTLLMGLFLSGCRSAADRKELTNYIGDTIYAFERGTKTDLSEKDNGVYFLEDRLQLIAPAGKIKSISLLGEEDEFTVLGLGLGMDKEDADLILEGYFESNTSRTVSNKGIVYIYILDNSELYVSYDIDSEKVIEISYYDYKTQDDDISNWDISTDGELIAIIGDTKVFYNEIMVYLKSAQDNYQGDYGEGIWEVDVYGDGRSFWEVIKKEVINQVSQLKIIKDKAPDPDYEVELNGEELAEARAHAKKHLQGISDRDIDKYHITLDLLEEVYRDNILADKMFETVTINVDTIVPDDEVRQITVWDIFISGKDHDDLSKAKGILEEAKESENFYGLAQINSEADQIEYVFGKGQGPEEYGQAFEDAAFKLSAGQVSELVSTEEGWHIIYCVSDFNEDATIQIKEEIIEQRRLDMFADLYEEWSSQYDVIINSQAWDSISFED